MTKACKIDISNKVTNLSLSGAMFVAFIHLREYVLDGDVGNVLWSIFPGPILQTAVPFFFVAAGYWLVGHAEEKGWWTKAVKSRVRSLLIPFAVLNFAAFVIGGDYTFRDFFTAMGFVRGEYPALPQLWFVFRLFGFVLASPILLFLVPRSRRIALLIIVGVYCSVCLRACYVGGVRDPFGIISVFKYVIPPVGLAEVMLGMVFRIYGIPEIRKKIGWGALAIGFGVLLTRQFAPLQLGFPMLYVGIPIFLWGLWNVMSSRVFMPYFAEATFGIYLFHYSILRVIYYLLVATNSIEYAHNIVSEVVIVLISVVGSAVLTHAIRKIGCLRGILLGGR